MFTFDSCLVVHGVPWSLSLLAIRTRLLLTCWLCARDVECLTSKTRVRIIFENFEYFTAHLRQGLSKEIRWIVIPAQNSLYSIASFRSMMRSSVHPSIHPSSTFMIYVTHTKSKSTVEWICFVWIIIAIHFIPFENVRTWSEHIGNNVPLKCIRYIIFVNYQPNFEPFGEREKTSQC